MFKPIVRVMFILIIALAVVQPVASTSKPESDDLASGWLVTERSQVGGSVGAIAIRGSYAFVGQGARLVALDIADKSNPVVVGQSASLRGVVSSLAISENALYASTGSALSIFDVTAPETLAQIGSYALGGDLSVMDQNLYVTNAEGLHILDIVNPAAPALESTFPLSDGIRSAVAGQYAYVLDRNAGDYRMQIVDISDPSNPIKISEYTGIDTYPYVIGILGNFAIIGCYAGVEYVDISDPANPHGFAVGFGDYDPQAGEGKLEDNLVRSLVVSGNYAYFAGFHTLSILHMDEYGNLAYEGELAILDEPNAIAAGGGYVYMGGSQAVLDPVQVNLAAGMAIIDVQQPASPTLVGVYRGLIPDRLKLEGERLYYINTDELGVMDVADPEAPAQLGTYSLTEAVTGLDVSPGYAYYSTENSLHVVDVSDPADIQPRGFYTTTASVRGIDVVGSYAYLAEYGYGLRVIDVSDPDNPAVAGELGIPIDQSLISIRVSGSIAYLASESSYLHAVDISDPTNPTKVGAYNTPEVIYRMDAAGGYVYYIGQMSAKLRILDATDPAAIGEAGEFDLAPVPQCVTVSAGTAYVCNTHAWGGLRIIDVSDAYNPAELLLYKTPGTQYDIQVSGNLIYVNDGENGLLILELLYQDFQRFFLPLIQ